ncbi:hypothetical protein L218DRAFT_301342 [Marasmius fiardii PR-910]|nr:hypothetical protein L218DRAFT_301342 [Marasmius fiardii PR-910]
MNQSFEEEKHRLRSCKDEIAQIRRRLTVLEEEERFLESNISRRRFALEIWPRIPAEIWATIFMMVCTPTPRNRHNDPVQEMEHALIIPAVALSHVCSRWRTNVLISPRLWTNIHITINRVPPGAAHLVQVIIQRSKKRPLDIHLSGGGFDRLSDHAFAVWAVLLGSSEHWKSLVFDQINPRELTDIGEVPVSNPPFPNLISFESSVGTEGINENNWIWKVLYQAPKLQTVETDFLYPSALLPYARITSLTITQFSSDSDESVDHLLFGVLPRCEKLCHLTLDFDGFDSVKLSDTDRYSAIQLPRLRSLEIQGHGAACSLNDSDFLEAVFVSLRMPVLDSFHLQFSLQALERWPESLLAMLEHSPSLQHLSLWSIDFDNLRLEEPLSKILATTPNLTHFEFRMCDIFARSSRSSFHADELLFSFLSQLRSPSRLLPKLECLSLLRDCEAPSYSSILRELLNGAQLRVARQVNSPLRIVQLRRLVGESGTSAFSPRLDMLEQMHRLKQNGVSVIVEDLPSSDLYDW